jgi:ABC-type sugar transport system substrate-binding protein
MPEAIGLFLRSADNAYQKRLAEVALQAAKRHRFKLLIESVQFDVDRQVAQVRAAIKNAASRKLTAILVSGVRDSDLAPVAHEAAAAGLDWVLLNEGAFIDEVRREHPGRAVFLAACDMTEIGRVHAQQVRALLGNTGRVLCVTGLVHNVDARLRLQGLRQGLGSRYDIIEVNADWTSEGARRAVDSWSKGITAPEEIPAVVVAQNDEMALGVRQALRDLDCDRDWPVASTPIVGCDGAERFGQRLVREGRMKATVIMPPGSGAAIDWIARWRESGEMPPVRVMLPVVSFPTVSRLKR